MELVGVTDLAKAELWEGTEIGEAQRLHTVEGMVPLFQWAAILLGRLLAGMVQVPQAAAQESLTGPLGQVRGPLQGTWVGILQVQGLGRLANALEGKPLGICSPLEPLGARELERSLERRAQGLL